MKTLFAHLCGYAELGRISFAMPGHKGGRGFSADFKEKLVMTDVTELADTENLHAPKQTLAQAQERLARLYGSKKSFFLTGGSTEGVHIMIYAACAGGKLLVNRSCHRSVINCCVLSGIEPVFIPQETDAQLLVAKCVTPESVEKCFIENPDAAAVLITTPSYYGQIADVEAIAKVCHRHGAPLLADEAHGAHFAADGMPMGAVYCGADMAVQSAHKTLNALNQAAYLHVSGDIIDIARVTALTSMIGTSSPSYPIAASAQLAAEELSDGSWRRLADYIEEKKRGLLKRTRLFMSEGDPARAVFGFRDYDITGYEVERRLRQEYNIDIEMSDYKNAVCIITPSNTQEEIDLLFEAVERICAETGRGGGMLLPSAPLPTAAVSPKRAFYADGETVPLEKAAGRVSKALVCAYPPGIALVCFGEQISKEMIEYINTIREMGASVEGLEPDGGVSVMLESI